MDRLMSLRGQFYGAARDLGDIESAAKGPGSYAKTPGAVGCLLEVDRGAAVDPAGVRL